MERHRHNQIPVSLFLCWFLRRSVWGWRRDCEGVMCMILCVFVSVYMYMCVVVYECVCVCVWLCVHAMLGSYFHK